MSLELTDNRPRLLSRIHVRPAVRSSLWIVLLLAAALSLLAWYRAAPHGLVAGFTGSESYSTIARNWVERGRYSLAGDTPTAYRPPAYPALLAACMWLFQDSWRLGALVIQLGLGVACGLLVFALLTRVFQDRLAGALGVVLYVTDICFQAEVTARRETVLFTALLLAFFYILLSGATGTRRMVLLALFAGLAYLTRPVGALLIAVFLFALVLDSGGPRVSSRLRRVGIGITVLIFTIAPWHVYVYHHFKTLTFAPTCTGGLNLYQGNNPATDVIYPYVDVDLHSPEVHALLIENGIPAEDELAVDTFLRAEAKRYIREHPLRFLRAGAVKALALYSPVPVPLGTGQVRRRAGQVVLERFTPHLSKATFAFTFHGLLLLGGTLFFWATRRQRGVCRNDRAVAYLMGFLVLVTLLHAVTFGETRFRLPLDPLLILFAALAGAGWWRRRNTRATVG
ncbi:MAG: ArnT family glycosyltransferase [Phycisphaerae bacterium]